MSEIRVRWKSVLEEIGVSLGGVEIIMPFEKWEQIYFKAKQCQEENTAPGTFYDLWQEELLKREAAELEMKESLEKKTAVEREPIPPLDMVYFKRDLRKEEEVWEEITEAEFLKLRGEEDYLRSRWREADAVLEKFQRQDPTFWRPSFDYRWCLRACERKDSWSREGKEDVEQKSAERNTKVLVYEVIDGERRRLSQAEIQKISKDKLKEVYSVQFEG